MHYLIEEWSETEQWLSLSVDERKAVIDQTLAAVSAPLEQGLTLVASGITDQGVAHSTKKRYFAVWRTEDEGLINQFLEALTQSGWFDYMQQTNIAGANQDLSAVLEHQVSL